MLGTYLSGRKLPIWKLHHQLGPDGTLTLCTPGYEICAQEDFPARPGYEKLFNNLSPRRRVPGVQQLPPCIFLWCGIELFRPNLTTTFRTLVNLVVMLGREFCQKQASIIWPKFCPKVTPTLFIFFLLVYNEIC